MQVFYRSFVFYKLLFSVKFLENVFVSLSFDSIVSTHVIAEFFEITIFFFIFAITSSRIPDIIFSTCATFLYFYQHLSLFHNSSEL